ncbi:MAG: hypothetical protein AAFR35_13785 [Pseudomonadota bacterium]
MTKARVCQQAFIREYGHVAGILGIGLGLTDDRTEATIEVFVDQEQEEPDLPATFEGLQVRKTPTTGAKALAIDETVDLPEVDREDLPTSKSKVVRR